MPLAGGLLYTYESGTTTPLETFTDNTGNTPNTNPIVLDANGYCDIWIGDTPYKFVLHDADDNPVRTVDPVQSLAAQIAAQINIAGALSITGNLSDVADKVAALVNLNIAPFSYPVAHAITNGQSASLLSGETFDGTAYTSVIYNYEIIQGTTIQGTGDFSVHYLNGTWVYCDGIYRGTAHGITLSLSQSTTIGQLLAAESGSGNGTLTLKRHYFFA
jgi:hypothetical protein